MTRSTSTDKIEALRPPTPTEQVRALPRVAHDTYHHVPAKKIADAIALANGTGAKLPRAPMLVTCEKKGEKIEVRIGDKLAMLTREEARDLGATLMQLARS